MGAISLVDSAKFYKRLPHQDVAWNWLQQQLSEEILADFAKKYRSADDATEDPVKNPLSVPYFSQRDSNVFVQGRPQANRMCFSSSCAMLLEFLKPGALVGANGDDQYIKRVLTYGDTTNVSAQILALKSYGIQARFIEDADFSTIELQINRGIPVPCGFLHHGLVSAPKGGGHWLCVVGYTATAVYVNDPFGEIDLIHSGYTDVSGQGLLYSRKNFGRRWMVLNDGSYAPAHGWAILAEPPD